MVRSAILGLITLGAMLGVSVTGNAGGNGDTPTRWEYRVLSRQNLMQEGKLDLAAGLNELGAQGWELVAIDGGRYIFKRRRRPSAESVAELKRRLTEAEGDVEAQRAHLAWSTLMARKGVVSDAFVQTEERLMKQAQAAAEQARRDLDARLLPEPKKAPEPQSKK